jgi:integrase
VGKLTALAVRSAKTGRHGDGDGLYLLVAPAGSKSWVLRVQRHGRRRDVGLGSLAALDLGEARKKAAELRAHALNGRDPIAERDKDRRPPPTFREAAKACHEALAKGWTDRHADAFLATLEDHAYPGLGNLRVDSIEATQIANSLGAIWMIKPSMARKVRQRIGTVLNFSKGKGWRASEAPAAALSTMLPRHGKGGNFAAMPYSDVLDYISALRAKPETMGRLALMFTILTAARSGEVRAARWSHIDLERKLWNRPANLMKGRVAHSITLNDAAVKLLTGLNEARLIKDDALIFHGAKGKSLSDMTLSKVLRDDGLACTVHGFRSSFRDWAAEQCQSIPDPVAEAALAHTVPDKVIAAYKRTKFVEMRRQLLDAWGSYLVGGSNVVKLAVAQ